MLDAVGAERPCILTPFANEPLGMVDGESALIRERSVPAFAEAILRLLHDADLRRQLADGARGHLAEYSEEAVAQAWRDCLEAVRNNIGI